MPLKRPPHRSTGSSGSTLLFVGALTALIIFYVFYTHGVGQGKTEANFRMYELKKRGEAATAVLSECRKEMTKRATKLGEVSESVRVAQAENVQLENEVSALQEEVNQIDKLYHLCQENVTATTRQWQTEDETNSQQLMQLQAQHARLVSSTKRLTGTEGMRTLLLLQILERLTSETRALRSELGLDPIPLDTSYIEKLVSEWSSRDGEAMQIGTKVRLPEVDTFEKSTVRFTPYNEDRDAAKVFFPRFDGKANSWNIPSWNNRRGTQPVRKGTFVDTDYNPITDVHKQIRTMYNYAMCAVGLNITRFTYPTKFKTCRDCPTEYLHEYIETPVVLFCEDCLPQHHANEFELLCAGFLDREHYGSALFWRARSRLVFKGKFRTMAREYLQKHGYSGRDVALAVRLPRSSAFKDKACGEKRMETLCYSRLLKGSAKEISEITEQQCFQEWNHVYVTLSDIAKDSQGEKKPVFYISTDATDEEWENLKKAVPGADLLRSPKTGHQSTDTIVDNFVAASTSALLINRFEKKSAQMAESFMLNNQLRHRRIQVW